VSRITLVTGAGGGLGAEICRQLLGQGDTVLACPRVPGSEVLGKLRSLHAGRLHEVPMDVADPRSIESAVHDIERVVERIDVLFNNAGIYPRESGGLPRLDPEELVRAFRVNSVGPLLVVQALLPLLRRGKDRRLIQITSLMGSVEDNTSGGSYAYRMSKCALNMATRNLAHELGPEGFVALAVHPGWVRTRMGGPAARTDLGPATAELLRIALETGPEHSGSLFGPGGKRLPY
jgi:NAD(P)-dependent dehydrogenase (short-subunit alcohol dehydrogenase family)